MRNNMNAWIIILGPDLQAEAAKHGGAFPLLEAGRIFREISMRYGAPDNVCANVAGQLGLWKATPQDVLGAAKLQADIAAGYLGAREPKETKPYTGKKRGRPKKVWPAKDEAREMAALAKRLGEC